MANPGKVVPVKVRKPKLTEREKKIATYERLLAKLNADTKLQDPKWTAGMIRHYNAVLERLRSAK
jgi:hypothetical protein